MFQQKTRLSVKETTGHIKIQDNFEDARTDERVTKEGVLRDVLKNDMLGGCASPTNLMENRLEVVETES